MMSTDSRSKKLTPTPQFHVYVIELDLAAVQSPGPKGVVYVGETSLTPEERFAKHKSGIRAGRKVQEHGLRLRPDLAPKSGFPSRESALRAEEKTANRLRKMGYTVLGGQGTVFMDTSSQN